jgi:hypothetical protein
LIMSVPDEGIPEDWKAWNNHHQVRS